MEYYIVLNGMKEGPFTLEQLKGKGVTESTLVWKSGLPDWVKANTLPEVMQAITAPAVPQAHKRHKRHSHNQCRSRHHSRHHSHKRKQPRHSNSHSPARPRHSNQHSKPLNNPRGRQ